MFREDEAALDPSQKVILSPSKVSEIRQYIRLYRPDLLNSVPMDRPVRCQCAWDGEDPAMVSLWSSQMLDTNDDSLNAPFAIHANMHYATDSKTQTTPSLRTFMPVTYAFSDPTNLTYWVR